MIIFSVENVLLVSIHVFFVILLYRMFQNANSQADAVLVMKQGLLLWMPAIEAVGIVLLV